MNLRECWVDLTIKLIEEGGVKLSLPDKSEVVHCVNLFFEDYLATQGREPLCSYKTMPLLYYPHLVPLGFSMPRIERLARRSPT